MPRIACLLVLLALARPAAAVDLTRHTLGIGAAGAFSPKSVGAPGELSVRAALTPRVLAGVLVGFQANPNVTFSLGPRFDWVLVPEEHMNLTFGLSMQAHVRSVGGLRAVTYTLGPAVELFAHDWPNLGLLLDLGLAGTLVSGTKAADDPPGIATAAPFAGAALHYYF